MKCKYRFRVDGKIRSTVNIPIDVSDRIFEFELEKGLITYINVTISVPRREDWPTICESPSPGSKFSIYASKPDFASIRHTLQSLQGLLSLYGLHSIDIENPEVEWLPENANEKEKLQLFSFKSELKSLPDKAIRTLPFELLARSVIAADAAADIELILNFFRRGMLDMYSRNYIEAIYDFYFILETLFAEGKFQKAPVYTAFKKSAQLRACFENAINDPSLHIGYITENMKAEFDKTYGKMSADQAIERVIDMRGYLHHHTLKRKDMWHPDNQKRFGVNALFLQTVTFKLCFDMAAKFLWEDSVVEKYNALVNNDTLGP